MSTVTGSVTAATKGNLQVQAIQQLVVKSHLDHHISKLDCVPVDTAHGCTLGERMVFEVDFLECE